MEGMDAVHPLPQQAPFFLWIVFIAALLWWLLPWFDRPSHAHFPLCTRPLGRLASRQSRAACGGRAPATQRATRGGGAGERGGGDCAEDGDIPLDCHYIRLL